MKSEFLVIMRKRDGILCRCKIVWYFPFLMIPMTESKSAGLSTQKHLNIITDPPPCFTIDIAYSLSWLSSSIYIPPANIISNLISSVHNTFCHTFNIRFLWILPFFSAYWLSVKGDSQWQFTTWAPLIWVDFSQMKAKHFS